MTRRFVRRLAVTTLLALAAGGCKGTLDAGSTRDVRHLLARHRVEASELHCSADLEVRAVTCRWRGDEAAVRSLTDTMGLATAATEPKLSDVIDQGRSRCGDLDGDALAVAGRPPALRLEAGMAFESLVLISPKEGDERCLALVYGYG